ncbi:MAG: hypothetical protein PHO79_10360 [Desulfoplanes sp.]|nr:hypothetical protein [Desulfoplanes sp.]
MSRRGLNEYLMKRVIAEKCIDRLKHSIVKHVHDADVKGVLLWPTDAKIEAYELEWELVLNKNISEDIDEDYDEDDLGCLIPLLGVRLFLEEGVPSFGIFIRWNSTYRRAAWRELNRLEIFFGGEVRRRKDGSKREWCLDIESVPLLDLNITQLAENIVFIVTKIDLILDDNLHDPDELPDDEEILDGLQKNNETDEDEDWDVE